MTLFAVLVFSLTFVLGSIPFGLIIARLFHVKDLRSRGSGNIGATNVTRVLGVWAGLLTFLLDLGKGSLSVLLASRVFESFWAGLLEVPLQEASWSLGSPSLRWTAGLFAVLGHCFSPWLLFRGGKGVATGLGVLAVLSPWAALGGAIAFGLTMGITRVGSLSSLSGLLIASVVELVESVLSAGTLGAHLWAGFFMIFVIVLRHEANLDALLNDQERKF